MNVALLASLAGHFVLAVVFFWVIAHNLEPSPQMRALLIRLDNQPQDDITDARASIRAATALTNPAADARAPHQAGLNNHRPSATDPKPAVSRQQPDQVSSPTSQITEMPPEQALPASAPDQPKAGFTDPTNARTVLATPVITASNSPSPSTNAGAPPITENHVLAMRPVEQKMLEKKLRRWQETAHRHQLESQPLRWSHKGQPYEARFTRYPAADDSRTDELTVEVTTTRDGKLLRTEMHMKMLAFSHFAQFVDRWDPRVQVHDDRLDGRFHSNSKIKLAWDRKVHPRFMGKVTTTARQVSFADTRGMFQRNEIFRGGLETGVKPIPMARRFEPIQQSETKQPGSVFRFDADTHIYFAADGSFSWRQEGADDPKREMVDVGPVYILGSKGTRFHVSGIVKGKVMVHTPESIVIQGDLTYAHETNSGQPGSLLGLVAGKHVEIAEPEVTGPGDLYVHAAIYARKRFRVRNFREREHAKLYLYGSLTAGSLSATEPRFATHIEFDQRLKEQRPPGYPLTDRFELIAWNGQWQEITGHQ